MMPLQVCISFRAFVFTVLALVASESYAATSVTTYTYDSNSNRVSETVTVDGTQNKNLSYAYDSNNRLTEITDNLDASQNISYTYDNNGNRTSKTQATNTSSYIYNAEDQLVRVEENSNTLASFAYDHQGMRIKKDGERGTELYTYDEQSVLFQTDENSALQAKYNYGPNQLLSITEPGEQQQYYLFDGLGSPITLTKPSGEISARYSYDAFGNKIQNSGNSANRFTFTGHEEDRETDLIYMKARYYDADCGCFLSEDNFGGFPDKLPSLNKYLYAYANPLFWRDPTGNYNEAGHFYTTYYVARAVDIDHETAHELAFYSQTPDEIGQYDAIRAQRDREYTRFSLNRSKAKTARMNRDESHPMHALTGEKSRKATKESLGKIEKMDLTDTQSLGTEIHTLADTFSHRKGGESKALGANAKLYEKRIGHLLAGTSPDQIHRRPRLYKEYVKELAETLARKKYGNDDLKIESAVKKALGDADKFIKISKELENKYTDRKRVLGRKGAILPKTNHSKVHEETPKEFRDYIILRYEEDTKDGSDLAIPENWDIPKLKGDTNFVEEDIKGFSRTIENEESSLRINYDY